jgi:hypothetical protein
MNNDQLTGIVKIDICDLGDILCGLSEKPETALKSLLN